MKTPFLRPPRLLLCLLGGFVLAQACSASDSDSGLGSSGGSGGVAGTGGISVIMPDAGTPMNDGGATGVSPLCGVAIDGCQPDEPLACSSMKSSKVHVGRGAALVLDQGGAAGFAGAAGGAGAPGVEGQAGGANGGAGGRLGSGGSFGEGGSGGVPASGGVGGGEIPGYACHVVLVGNAPKSACAPVGDGAVDAPCFTGDDCSAGLACVRYRSVARCRPYCCRGDEACGKGSYCTEQPLVDDSIPSTASAPLVPVCAPADECNLEDPYPCPDGRVCQCSAGKACLVVRTDGTTSCETPGQGELGGACPCQYGFVCSRATGTGVCHQLCATSPTSSLPACGKGARCQSSSELPVGFGVCVGG